MLKQKQSKITPQEAFEIIKDYLDRIEFYFVVNPLYAIKWAVNKNQYATANALLKHEERVAAKMRREMVDWLKILVPIGIIFLMMSMGFYIIITGLRTGSPPPAPAGGGESGGIKILPNLLGLVLYS